MRYKVRFMPSGQEFEVGENELILDAAIRQNIKVAYSCRNGTCRTCMFQVLEGDVVQEDEEYCLISKKELEARRRLICMSICKSDSVLEKASPKPANV